MPRGRIQGIFTSFYFIKRILVRTPIRVPRNYMYPKSEALTRVLTATGMLLGTEQLYLNFDDLIGHRYSRNRLTLQGLNPRSAGRMSKISLYLIGPLDPSFETIHPSMSDSRIPRLLHKRSHSKSAFSFRTTACVLIFTDMYWRGRGAVYSTCTYSRLYHT